MLAFYEQERQANFGFFNKCQQLNIDQSLQQINTSNSSRIYTSKDILNEVMKVRRIRLRSPSSHSLSALEKMQSIDHSSGHNGRIDGHRSGWSRFDPT
jgi:hypothetical protein